MCGWVSQVPGARLALVGDGPQRQELEQMFKGMPVKFMVRGEARQAGSRQAGSRQAHDYTVCMYTWSMHSNTQQQ